MKLSPRFYVLSLVALLFVLSFVVVPRATKSASKDEDKKTRSASKRPESKSRERAAESESISERYPVPTRVGAQPAASRKPGALKRIANFFKGVFVPGNINSAKASEEEEIDGDDPDLPAKKFMRNRIDKEEYMRLRDEYVASLRGLDPAQPLNPELRVRALNQKEAQQAEMAAQNSKGSIEPLISHISWNEIGPRPVPNGQTQQFPATAAVTGRATMIVVDPTNSNKVYLGAAQGGVWRSLDGGSTWTPIFDAAQSLSVGALALAPSDPTKLYVGTGEPNNSADSFFGVGIYRIDNVDTSPTLVGPINPSITTGTTTALTYNCFNGRAITKILVHPTDPATIFVSTAAAVSGAAGNALSNTIPPLALRGVFRSTNATAAAGSVTFSKIVVNTDGSLDNPGTGNTSIFDMALDPGFDGGANQTMLVTTSGAATGGAIYRSTNALAATPTFTQTLFPGFNGLVMHLAINKVGAVVTVYVASNEPSSVSACSSIGQAGRVRKSIDGGVTWSAPLTAAEGYCGGQCSYDNPVGVDPSDASIVYLGGNARGTCSDVLKKSTDGGTTFTRDDTNLHADSHFIFVDGLSSPHTVWFVNDGGVWKRQETAVAGGAPAGTAWLDENNGPLGTIQFVSLAVHPTDQFFTIGGTQDNGTEAQTLGATNWSSAESGDGGFALIDQSATDTTTVTMYHTFFNQTNNFIGFDRTNLGACLAVKDSWEFRGGGFANDPTLSCDGTAFTLSNGINKADTVLFYAPMALGPGGAGNPNTLYFGTNKLYRSTDRGDTMTIVSQNPIVAGVAVSAIGIAPANDNVRIVGLRNGKVFATTTGANPLVDTTFIAPTNATASATNKHVARAVIDPLNSNIAYVTLAYYTNPSTAGQIWQTVNLNSATPVWVSIGNTGNGLPNIPVNAFAVDGSDPAHPGVTVLYAGTDIGVYRSVDGGATWLPFGLGLPAVSVFDMAIQPTFRILRVATHGRGMWEIALSGSPTAANGSVTGTIVDSRGAPLSGVTINLSGTQSREAITDANGKYSFDSVETNGFYTATPSRANYTFTPENRSFSLLGVHTEASFTATANSSQLNPLDTNEFFVRQHYLDFLGREPDPLGLAGWVSTLNNCAAGDSSCDRVHVSEAFYRSQEFQERGYFAYRFYSASLGRKPDYAEFTPDLSRVSGFLSADQLEAAKTAFIDDFMARPAFARQYDGLSDTAFVDKLLQTAGVDLSSRRQELIDALRTRRLGRAAVLREIAESSEVYQKYYNQAFVVMEYFGYLHRDPDALYADWIRALDANPADSRRMVDGFVNSAEYRNRFAP